MKDCFLLRGKSRIGLYERSRDSGHCVLEKIACSGLDWKMKREERVNKKQGGMGGLYRTIITRRVNREIW